MTAFNFLNLSPSSGDGPVNHPLCFCSQRVASYFVNAQYNVFNVQMESLLEVSYTTKN